MPAGQGAIIVKAEKTTGASKLSDQELAIIRAQATVYAIKDEIRDIVEERTSLR